MFPSFEDWSKGSVAQAALRAIYSVMERASHRYSNGEWREHPPEYHLRKALIHISTAHQFGVDRKEDGTGAKTGLPEWTHALTRLAFVAALLPKREPLPIEIDTTVDDLKQE